MARTASTKCRLERRSVRFAESESGPPLWLITIWVAGYESDALFGNLKHLRKRMQANVVGDKLLKEGEPDEVMHFPAYPLA